MIGCSNFWKETAHTIEFNIFGTWRLNGMGNK